MAMKEQETKLLDNILASKDAIAALLSECSGYSYEDCVYRFYHQSFKVFYIQELTQKIVDLLKTLLPGVQLDKWFVEIMQAGTGKEFKIEDNDNWSATTRPILEAFFHAKYFIEMLSLRISSKDDQSVWLTSGWAAVLSLYGLR